MASGGSALLAKSNGEIRSKCFNHSESTTFVIHENNMFSIMILQAHETLHNGLIRYIHTVEKIDTLSRWLYLHTMLPEGTLLMDRSTRCLQKADFPEGFCVTQPLSEGNTF